MIVISYIFVQCISKYNLLSVLYNTKTVNSWNQRWISDRMYVENSKITKVTKVNLRRIYHILNADLDRNVFKFDLKMCTNFGCLIQNGSMLHSAGSHTVWFLHLKALIHQIRHCTTRRNMTSTTRLFNTHQFLQRHDSRVLFARRLHIRCDHTCCMWDYWLLPCSVLTLWAVAAG